MEAPEMDDDLKAVHEDRMRALVAGDLDTLDRCVADDLTYISPHGRVLSKKEVFDSIRQGKMVIQTMEVTDFKGHQFGDSAVFTYQAYTKFIDNGTIVDGNIRGTNIYLRRQGLWQLYLAQQTSIT
jgi:ketosteroid isomerase-like protein